MVEIKGVEVSSPAEKAGIQEGDMLLEIDSHPIKDVLDYRFFLTEENIELTLKRGEETFKVKIKKGRYDDIGLDFETFLMDQKRRCANNCIFCFIDQNPCGMRETVYFKDDDTRLSFLMGNYVTLTNVSDKELNRIVEMHLSPIGVSVHTTNPDLRVKMLGNKRAGRIMDQLKILKDGGTTLNCQIVCCRGINDGPELIRTVRDLETLLPQLESIAVVPAGLTRHREGLPLITPYDKASASEILSIVEEFQKKFLEKYDRRILFAADEFYLAASCPLPPEEAYDGFPQLDNGVGLLTSARAELLDEISYRAEEGLWDDLPREKHTITLITGMAAKDFLIEICREIEKHLPFLTLKVKAVKNRFFGETVTVAGLLCGKDILEAAKEENPEVLFIPAVSLRHERDQFLDNYTLSELKEDLLCPVVAVENGICLLDEIENLICGR